MWDRTVWHERGWLFGGALEPIGNGMGILVSAIDWRLVPLLAVPQIAHDVVADFLWRGRRARRAVADRREVAP